jgi:hypothetical protein
LNSVTVLTYQLNASGELQHCNENDPACLWSGDVVSFNKHISQASGGKVRTVPLVFNNAGTMITSFQTMMSNDNDNNYKQVIDTLTQDAVENDYDGLSLDLEPSCWQSDAALCPGWPSSKDAANYAKFVNELSQSLHGIGKTLSVAVGADPETQCEGGFAMQEAFCTNEDSYLSNCGNGIYNMSICNCCAFTTWFNLEWLCDTEVDLVVNMDTYMDNFDPDLFDRVMTYYYEKGCNYKEGRVAVGLLVQEGNGNDDSNDIEAVFQKVESYDGVNEVDIWVNLWESSQELSLWQPSLKQFLSSDTPSSSSSSSDQSSTTDTTTAKVE